MRLFCTAALFSLLLPAQTPDIHFVPTGNSVADAMLTLAQVTPDDVVYDLGSGDGAIVIRAAEKTGRRVSASKSMESSSRRPRSERASGVLQTRSSSSRATCSRPTSRTQPSSPCTCRCRPIFAWHPS